MSIDNRIRALKEKHAAADAEIQLLQLLPSNNQEKIRELKKQKLKFKDEIARLENPNRLTAPKKKKKREQSAIGAEEIQSRKVTIPSVSDESGDGIGLAA